MKAILKSLLLVLFLGVLFSSCMVAGPGYYRPRYRPVYGPVIRPIYVHPHYYGGYHYHHHYRGGHHYRR